MAERGEAKKCVEILKKIARTNGKEVKAEIYDSHEVHIFTVGDEGAVRSTCPLGGEKEEEEKEEERWKFGWQQ